MNARFWVWVKGRGPVKMTLRPGQSLHHHRWVRTEEGWSAETTTWTYDVPGGEVLREYHHEGRDCDGYLDGGCTDRCPIEELSSGHRDDDTVVYPKWTDVSGYGWM